MVEVSTWPLMGGGYFVSEHVMSEHMLMEHMQGPVQGRPGGEHMAPNGEILWG